MLILGRRVGDAILIDGGIRIVVLAADSRGVRLGIDAPRGVGVLREEIVLQIADENRRAAAQPGSDWLAGLGPDQGKQPGPESAPASPAPAPSPSPPASPG